MVVHPSIRCLLIDTKPPSEWDIAAYLNRMAHIQLDRKQHLPQHLDSYHVVITRDPQLAPEAVTRLEAFVGSGKGWLFIVTEATQRLPQIFGVQPEHIGTAAELRILLGNFDANMNIRLPETIFAAGQRGFLNPADDDTRVVLFADWRYSHRAVLTLRHSGQGLAAATTLQCLDQSEVQRILYRLIRFMTGQAAPETPIGAAVIGYAPWLGNFHASGICATAGLSLKGICDIDPGRRLQAQSDYPEVRLFDNAHKVADDPDIELVIVVTPPNTHSDLSIAMIKAGKHVVCEKPLALTSTQAFAMREQSKASKRLLCCHQNRRFDADYQTICRALDEGLIGDLFYLETFVGGFDHPCGYWHSHAPVSGGTAYDWGAHYLDWIVGLMPHAVEAVQGSRHNRVWHDVTNADQERIFIRFVGGREAEFIHSNIAAARKPKWYLLGTQGAVVGHWQDVSVHLPDPVHFFESHAIPATEMPPQLILYHRDAKGRISTRRLATTRGQPFAFHRNLADHIHLGEPLVASLADSIKVVSILEAAGRSADRNGTWEKPYDG